eukprot:3419267-Rhodomonas_salina.1
MTEQEATQNADIEATDRFRKTIADDQELKRDYQGWRKQVPKLIDPRVGKEAFENKIREVKKHSCGPDARLRDSPGNLGPCQCKWE